MGRTGATYRALLDLEPAALMSWQGRGYWYVNPRQRSLAEDCQEEVTEAG